MGVTQIGYAGSAVNQADVITAAADLIQSSKSSLFSDFLTSQNSAQQMAQKSDSTKDCASQPAGSTNAEAYDRYRYKDNNVDAAQVTDPSEKSAELSEETKQLASEIVSEVSGDLKVDEEELLAAMEALGLTALDLVSPQNLAELAMELGGMDDNTGILLDADFQQAFAGVTTLAEAFTKENGIDLSELSGLAAGAVDESAAQTDVIEPTVEAFADAEVWTTQEDGLAAAWTEVTSEQAKEQPADTQEHAVVVEDQRAPGEAKETTSDAQRGNEESVQIEAEEPRTQEKGNGREDSSSSGKQESQDFSQQLAAADNGQPVADVEAAAELPEYTSIDTQDIIDQIVEQTKITQGTESTSIEMQLNPENLGKIFLSITSREGAVSAQLFAQNEAVSAALESQIAALTEQLNQAGVRVDAIEVSVAAHEFERNLEQNAKGDEEQGRHEEGKRGSRRSLRLDTLDDLSGLMTEEEALVARMMKDNGNSVDFTA